MAKEIHIMKDMSGGINTYQDARDIADNQFSVLQNLTTDRNGSLKGHNSASILASDSSSGLTSCQDIEVQGLQDLRIQEGFGLGVLETELGQKSSNLPGHATNSSTGFSPADLALNWGPIGGSDVIFSPFQEGSAAILDTANVGGFVMLTMSHSVMGGSWHNHGTYVGLCADSTMLAGQTNATALDPAHPSVYPSSAGEYIHIEKYFPVGSKLILSNTATNSAFEDEDNTVIGTTAFPAGKFDSMYTVTQALHQFNNHYIRLNRSIYDEVYQMTYDDPSGFYKEFILDSTYNWRIRAITYIGMTGRMAGLSQSGDTMVLLADKESAKISAFSHKTQENSYGKWFKDVVDLDPSDIGGTFDAQVKYYSHDNAIRCCDINKLNGLSLKWYGIISRISYQSYDNTNTVPEFVGPNYFDEPNLIKPPRNDTTFIGGAGNNYPPIEMPGEAWGVRVIPDSEPDISGGLAAIPVGTYEFGQTFIYDHNQESLVTTYRSSTGVPIKIYQTVELKTIYFMVWAYGSTTNPYANRITGGRIYIRESGSTGEWLLFADIDLNRGVRTSLYSEYIHWRSSDTSAAVHYAGSGLADETSNIIQPILNDIDYEMINGYSSDTDSIDIGRPGENWQDAVIANDRCFVAGVNRQDTRTGLNMNHPTRIYYTEKERYDLFPSHNYIEAGINNAGSYVALSSYADRLLAYKQDALDVWNISDPVPSSWFIEDSKKHMGVLSPEAVTETTIGTVWVNAVGCYIYNGEIISDIIKNKISKTDWDDFYTERSTVTFIKSKGLILVTRDYTYTINSLGQKIGGDTYEYNTNSESWTFQEDLFSGKGFTNIIHNPLTKNILYAEKYTHSSVKFYKYLDKNQAITNTKFITKDIDFGDPTLLKRIYAIYITYKCNVDISSFLKIYRNGSTGSSLAFSSGTDSTTSLADGTIGDDVAWIRGKWAPGIGISSTCSSMRLELDTGTTAAILHINDISIEYRAIGGSRYES